MNKVFREEFGSLENYLMDHMEVENRFKHMMALEAKASNPKLFSRLLKKTALHAAKGERHCAKYLLRGGMAVEAMQKQMLADELEKFACQ